MPLQWRGHCFRRVSHVHWQLLGRRPKKQKMNYNAVVFAVRGLFYFDIFLLNYKLNGNYPQIYVLNCSNKW